MKKIIVLLSSLAICFCLTSCFSFVLRDTGLFGFDDRSRKNLTVGMENLPLKDLDVESVAQICREHQISVLYDDLNRTLEFYTSDSDFRLYVGAKEISFKFSANYSYDEKNGFLNPKTISFQCYGESFSESLDRSDVHRVNESHYNKTTGKTYYTRYETVTHYLSSDANRFLSDNWTGGHALVVSVDGKWSARSGNGSRSFGLITLYRMFYDDYNMFEYLENASYVAIIEELQSRFYLSADDARQIISYVDRNTLLTKQEKEIIKDSVRNKIV